MLTSEQVVEYLIMIDLQRKGVENKLNAEGLSTLLDLQSDKELKDIKIVDVLDYIHTQDEEIEELKTRVSELQDKDWYEKCIKQLEEQNDKLIKERDELVFEKRNIFGLMKKMEIKVAEVTKEKIQEIRKQVCNEIREKLKEAKLIYVWKGKDKSIDIILDQIEKGEK